VPVYLIRAGEHGPVKIGWAEDANDRLGALQTGHWHELKIVRLIDGTPATKHWLHQHYATRRIKREWFDFCETMLTIQPPTLMPRAEWCDPILDEVEEFIAAHRMSAQEFGTKAMNDPTFVYELRKGRECRRATRAKARAFIAAVSRIAA
jgi:Meiotically up-regulated gene 113